MTDYLYEYADAGPDRRVELTKASDIKPQPVRWLWENRIPVGEITLTPGFGGVGKSSFHAWLIAQLTKGTLPGVYLGESRPAIICAREDSWERSIVPRLIAADANLDLVYRAEVSIDNGPYQTKITLPADNEALRGTIVRLGAALVSLDPLMSAIEESLDSYKSREIREALEPLHGLADETNCIILGNAHFNKSSGSDPVLRVSGAAAFSEVCRAILSVKKVPEFGTVVSWAQHFLWQMKCCVT